MLFRSSRSQSTSTWGGELSLIEGGGASPSTISDARLEIALQSTFHGPLAYSLHDLEFPIFTRLRMPTPEEVEAGLGIRHERSFYRNSFSMVRTQDHAPALRR